YQLLVEGERLPDFIENIHLRFNADWGSTAITFDQWYANLSARLGETFLSLGHYKEAREVLEKAYQAYPSNTRVIHQLARLNLSEGKYAEAGKLLREIVAGKSSNPDVVVDFARCALQDASIASTDEVILHLEKVLELHPDHFEALTLLAQVLGRSDQPHAALKLYDQILRFPQAREQPLREQLAFEVSQTALKAGEYEFALTTLLECDPNNLLTQQHLAETYSQLGLFQEAAQAAHIARSLNESDLATLTWYAKLFDRLAELDASHALEFYSHSIEALQKSIELAPQRSDLSLALAEALYHIGDSLRAKEILMRFTTESQSETCSTASDTEFMKAAQYLNLLGETDAALACYKKILTLLQASPNLDSKKTIQVLSAMAEIYRQNQRYGELKDVLEQAIHFCPDNLPLFMDFIAAWLEVNSNCVPIPLVDHTGLNLLTRFEDHLKQNPDEKPLVLLYGLFLRWIGDSTKAIEYLTQFIADLKASDEVHSPESRLALLLTAITELSRIHRCRGEQHLADYWLEEGVRNIDLASFGLQKKAIELACDWLEAIIARGEEHRLFLFDFCKQNADHPRAIALMSLVKINQEDRQGAKRLFEVALAG
ncbi:MAG: tetratricopeptide repeat protein, partial [Anaerolineales bacterium]